MSNLQNNTTGLQSILAAVNALPEAGSGGGVDLSEATATDNPATENHILLDKVAWANGEQVIGKIATKTASDLTASGATVTVPVGYYASETSKSVDTTEQETPSITVNSSGLITATVTQPAGYVSAGTKSDTRQLTTQAAKAIKPGTGYQTAVASGVYTTGEITVEPIPSSYVQPTGTKSITANGTHDVKNYANVEVNVAGSGGGGSLETVTGVVGVDREYQVSPIIVYYMDETLTSREGEFYRRESFTVAKGTIVAFIDPMGYGVTSGAVEEHLSFNDSFVVTVNSDFTLGE